jgi:hypothetical protein
VLLFDDGGRRGEWGREDREGKGIVCIILMEEEIGVLKE